MIFEHHSIFVWQFFASSPTLSLSLALFCSWRRQRAHIDAIVYADGDNQLILMVFDYGHPVSACVCVCVVFNFVWNAEMRYSPAIMSMLFTKIESWTSWVAHDRDCTAKYTAFAFCLRFVFTEVSFDGEKTRLPINNKVHIFLLSMCFKRKQIGNQYQCNTPVLNEEEQKTMLMRLLIGL